MLEIQEEVLFKPNQDSQTIPNTQIEILKKYFPNCFDKAGSFLTHQLEDILKNAHTDLSKEYYSLNWLGKSYAKLLRDLPTDTLLAPDDSHNKQPENKDSNNILISGDNLDVLKQLKNAYAEKIKMIYIDPPYNTGTDGFVYNDKYNFKAEQLAELADISVDEAERILKFTQRESNSHSAWLTFMYPRLYIARTLLKDDGVIFISIDDNEVAQLRLLCDEIFGEENFVAEIPWRKRTAKADVPFGVSQDYEHILAYAKSDKFLASIVGKGRKYYETDDFPNRPWRIHDLTKQTTASERPNSFFTLIDLKTNKEYPANANATWRITKDTFQDYYDKGKIVFPDDYDFLKISRPVMRYFKDEDMKKAGENFGRIALSTNLPEKVGMSLNGTKEVTEIFGQKLFSFPKPTALIKYLLESATKNNDFVLDFFAGSGTTADAVMQLNAEDGGSRRFMLVQLPEQIDPKKSKAAYDFVKNDLGKKDPTIFDITKERIIRSAKKILTENGEYQGDLGFKVYTIIPNEIMYKNAYVSPQMELLPRTELTEDDYQALLTTWRLNDGEPLTQEVMIKDLVNYPAYLCGKNLYLLYPNFESNQIKALIERLDNDKDFMPNRIIFYGEQIVSSKQKELAQALASYANKKGLDISLVARY